MVKEDRKSTKIASAARAGQLLASGGGTSTPAFGFGGYVGSQSLAGPASEPTASDPDTSQLDGEIQLHLRRLSKRDPVTKLKALQALTELTKESSARDLELMLPSWSYLYQRLAMDNTRGVREHAASLLGTICGGVGRRLAPFLKTFIGPWYMAQHDLQPEVAAAARASMASVFPGPKAQEALNFCRTQILEYFGSNLKAAPEVLGDPQRESPEEILDRYNRVIASTILSIAAFAASGASDSSEETAQGVAAIFQQPGFWKKFLGSKAPVVRRCSYHLVGGLVRRNPECLREGMDQSAPVILGSLAEKEPSCHGEMWGMYLSYSKALPEAWRVVDAKKAVLPKLLSLLRQGCFGSGEASFPALLPLLTLLPEELTTDGHSMCQILDAVIAGCNALASDPGATSKALEAAISAYVECWFYLVVKAQKASAADMIQTLAKSLLSDRLLWLALQSGEKMSAAALKMMVMTAAFPGQEGGEVSEDTQEVLLSALGGAIRDALGSARISGQGYRRLDALIASLHASLADRPGQGRHSSVSDALARPAMSCLLESESRESTPEAAVLLASLIRRFGDGADIGDHTGGDATLESALQLFTSQSPSLPASLAHADVLLACIAHARSPAAALSSVLVRCIDQVQQDPQSALSRMQLILNKAAQAAPAGKLAEWRSPALDEVAFKLVTLGTSSGDQDDTGPQANQVLGLLVRGDGVDSFLTPRAVSTAFSTWHALASSRSDTELLALVGGLELCLFTRALWKGDAEAVAVEQLLDVVECVYAAARLSWEADSAVSTIWKEGSPLLALRPHLTTETRGSITGRLSLALARALQSHLASQEEHVWTPSFADSLVELHNICGEDVITSVLLSGSPSWPHYAARPSQQPSLAPPSGSANASNLDKIAVEVVQKLGNDSCVAIGRGWLVAEVLCLAAASTSSALDLQEAIEESLTSSVPSMAAHLPVIISRLREAGSHGSDALVSLVDAALSTCDTKLSQEESLGIVRQLLEDWIASFADGAIPGDQAHAFASLVRSLRAHSPQQQGSVLARFSLDCIAKALALPPLFQSLTASQDQFQATLSSLQSVAACFPLPAQPDTAMQASEAEIGKLHWLGQEHLEAESSSLRPPQEQGDAASVGSYESTQSDLVEGERTASAERLQAALLTSVMTYCWPSLNQRLKDKLFKRVRQGVQEGTAMLEDYVELLSQAAITVSSGLIGGASSQAASTPQSAMGVLWKLQMTLAGDALLKFQEATEGIEAVLLDEDNSSSIIVRPAPWLQAAAVLLSRAHPQTGDLGEDVTSVISDSFRCAYVVGVVASLSQVSGESGRILLSHWVSDCFSLLSAISACCTLVISRDVQLAEAAKAMDLWADDMGVGSVPASLGVLTGLHAFSDELQGILRAALHSLLLPDLLRALSQDPIDDEDEGFIEAQSHGRYDALVAAGLSSHLASSILEPGSSLLPWAVVLVLLLELPSQSPRLLSISQAIHDSHSLVPTLLDSLVAHLPLESHLGKRSAQLGAKPLPKPEPGAAAAVAALNRAQGAAPEAWNFRKSLVTSESLDVQDLAPLMYRAVLRALPASSRSWFQSLGDRKLAQAVEAYTTSRESSFIITDELAGVVGKAAKGEQTDAGSVEFSIRANHANREAVALVSLESSPVLELAVQLPAAWPLQDAKLDCRKGMGVAEGRLRKWMLSITALLRSQNGALSQAIVLWQQNCARQFDGVEECLICYNVIQDVGGQLPKLGCKTCSKRYHTSCLFKWFRSSQKSTCPHCQSAW